MPSHLQVRLARRAVIATVADIDCADLEGGYFLASKITLRSMLSRGMESQSSNFRWFLLPLK